MARSYSALLALLLLTGSVSAQAGKPAPPPPTTFVPALTYQYNNTDIRLANADGSQAVLLVRMPLGPNATVSVDRHALAPLGRGQVAFVYSRDSNNKELRIVDWSQPTPGGPLVVSLDPRPLFTMSGTGADITSVDFSPDGNRILATNSIQGRDRQLRFFDAATRTQIGDPILLAQDGSNAKFRALDGSVLMRGGFVGFSIYKDGVQTPLFYTGNGGYFDPFNGTMADVVIQTLANAEFILQRWDGTSLTTGGPVLTTITQGYHPSVSCDSARMIFQRGTRAKTIVHEFASRTETAFSQDVSISLPTFPNSCG